MINFLNLMKLLVPYRKLIFLGVVLGFLTVGSNIGLLAVSAVLISSAALHPPVLDLLTLVVGVRFFGISRAVLRYLERYLTHDVTFRILSNIRVWFYSKLEPLAPALLMHYQSGDLLSRIVGDVDTLKFFYLRVLVPSLVFFMVLGTGFLLLLWFYWPLAIVFSFFFLLAGVGIPSAIKGLIRDTGRKIAETKGELNGILAESMQGMAEIIAFGRDKEQQFKTNEISSKLIKLQDKTANFQALSSALVNLSMNLAMCFSLVLAIPLVARNELNGIYLAMLPLAVLAGFEAVQPAPLVFQYFQESLKAAGRLLDIVNMEPVVIDTVESSPPYSERPAITINGLCFRYSPKDRRILNGLNFEVPGGERLALVGPSGSGKSTLINLLLRFWDYEEGYIGINGQEIKSYNSQDLRRLVGVVTQDTYLFNATIRENLLLANSKATEEQMMEAARRAKIHEFIIGLPDGYETSVGMGGFKLSGGQRQRLAVARVLLKDAPILILDEATVGLDAVTEKELMEEIMLLAQAKTTLVVTHRLTGLNNMDRILVLDQGKVVEQGKHEELLLKRGRYFQMWNLQRQVLNQEL
ncbi:MAG: thiol reductant ABC exporter subunit CydC [Bacillota bacterium]